MSAFLEKYGRWALVTGAAMADGGKTCSRLVAIKICPAKLPTTTLNGQASATATNQLNRPMITRQ